MNSTRCAWRHKAALLCLAGSGAVMWQPATAAQPLTCLAQAKTTISPGAWESIQAYFRSLTLGDPAHDKVRLVRLRAAIADLQSELAAIVRAEEALGAYIKRLR